MSELSPNARRWLDAARDADDPTPEQRARADAAARLALAMHGLTDLPPLQRQPTHPQAGAGAKLGSTLSWKLALSAAALLAAGLYGADAVRRGPVGSPAAAPPVGSPAAAPPVGSP